MYMAAHIVAQLRAHDEHVAQVVQRERPQLAVRQRAQRLRPRAALRQQVVQDRA